MTKTINGAALKMFRETKGLSQRELAEASGVSKEQIGRYERAEFSGLREENIRKLTEALSVSLQDLSEEPEAKHEKEPIEKVQISFRVDPQVRNNLILASSEYHVNQVDIIELAPLLFSIIAENSLEARRENLRKVHSHYDELVSASSGVSPFLRKALMDISRGNLKEMLAYEQEQIDAKKIIKGLRINSADEYAEGYWEEKDPFYEYLVKLSGSSPQEGFSRIGHEFLTELLQDIEDSNLKETAACLGIEVGELLNPIDMADGYTDLKPVFINHIYSGKIDLNDLIKKIKNSTHIEFLEWIILKLKEIKTKREADLKGLDIF